MRWEMLIELTLNGKYLISSWTVGSDHSRPMRRLTSKTVFSGLVVSWCLAASPTSRTPSEVNATYEGVIRLPWSLAIISTRPFLYTPTLEREAWHETSAYRHSWQVSGHVEVRLKLNSPWICGTEIDTNYDTGFIWLILTFLRPHGGQSSRTNGN